MKKIDFVRALIAAMIAPNGFGEKLKTHGKAVFTQFRGGIQIDRWEVENLITDDGFDFISDVIGNGTQPGDMDHIAIGEGTTAADAADSTLENELARKPAVYAHIGGTKVFTQTVTFNAGEATGAITEAGVLNALVLGVLLDRLVFPVKNIGAPDSLQVQFTFTLS